MTSKTSGGILLYRFRFGELEVFLVHPGGPYWERKDDGAWSIPKGEIEEGEDPLEVAKREFLEETGSRIEGQFRSLTPLKQPSGKVVQAWAVEGEIDASTLRSNTFAIEWPPRSGVQQKFPEVDKGEWFPIQTAQKKLLSGQVPFLDELHRLLSMVKGAHSDTDPKRLGGENGAPAQGTQS